MSRRVPGSRAATAAALALLVAAPALAGALRLPQATKTTLKNGLTVLVMPTPRLPLVDFLLEVRAGSVNDPPGKEGLAGLTADLLTQGAGSRNAKQIAEAIAFVGGTLGASSGVERSGVSCEVLQRDFATGLELLRDVAVRPTFPAEEFARKKDEALGAIASARDDPGETADRELLPFLLGPHPLGHPVEGWANTVGGLTRDDVVQFHAREFTPDNAMLAVVGDVEPRAVIAAVEEAFRDWRPAGGARERPYAPIATDSRREVLLVSRPEATQSQIRMACPSVPRNHPDYFPILVANTILGGGFTSRLVNEIRVVQGLTYSIGSEFVMYRNAGEYEISTFTRNATLRQTIDQTLKTAQRLRDEGPTPEELEKAQRYLTGQFPLGLQAPDALAGRLLDVEFYGLAPDYLTTFADQVDAVTLEDCRRALKSYFCTDQLKILVVTEPDSGKAALSGLGPLKVQEPR
jgi:zinc protease